MKHFLLLQMKQLLLVCNFNLFCYCHILSSCYCTFSLHAVSPEGSATVTPLDIIANFNDNVTLVCNAMGGPSNLFQWEINGTVVSNDSEVNLMATDASYGGNYTCSVRNAAGNDSASTTLYVAPYIVTPLVKRMLTINGSNLTIHCNATGFPTPSMSWVDTLGVEVSTTSLLQFNPVIFGDEGVYHCVAKSVINLSLFNATDETTLTGNYCVKLQKIVIHCDKTCILFSVSPKGSVRVSPQDIISTKGDTITLVCIAMGGPSNLFVWTMDGNIIGNENIVNVTNIDASHGGNYTCTVSNAAGAESVSTNLYVAPYIETPLGRDILGINGSNLSISCNAAGFPIPVVKWVDMQDIEVSNSSRLQFSPVMFGDEGLYRCVATAEIGETIYIVMNETTLVGKLALHFCHA